MDVTARTLAVARGPRRMHDLLGAVFSRRWHLARLRGFAPPVRVIFGAARMARRPAALFPHGEPHLLPEAGHVVQAGGPERVAGLVLASWRHETHARYGA